MTQIAHPELDGIGKYEYGWADKTDAGSNSRRGLNEEVVRDISSKIQKFRAKSRYGQKSARKLRLGISSIVNQKSGI